MAGLYLHIPFCKSRCIYCGFYSTTLSEKWQDRYVEALCREMEMRGETSGERGETSDERGERSDESGERRDERGERIETIYLGGGTPSLLTKANLQRLFAAIGQHYDISALQEVTIECNPDDVTAEFCQMLISSLLPSPLGGAGGRPGGSSPHRVSLGIQTFSNERLRFLHRRHTAQQAVEAVNRLRQAGIANVSIDLMFGFPGQTLDQWLADIRQAVALQPQHISAYSLMIEEGTPLYKWIMENGEWKMENGSDELSRRMYEALIDALAAAGYEHYEISNWCLPGFRSRHNSSYWNQTPYIGIGAAAHSYDGHTRSWNVSDLQQYVESIEQGKRPFTVEVIDEDTRYNDLITTALRTRDGISLNTLPDRYRRYLLQQARRSLDAGFLTIETSPTGNSFIHLTRQGLFVSDDVMSDLIWV